MQLYNITAQLRLIIDRLEETGELTAEDEAAIDGLQLSLENKVESIAGLYAEFRAYADAARAQAERLSAIASTKERAANRIKDYLFKELKKIGIRKMQTPSFPHIRIQANPPGMKPIVDPEQLAPEFQRKPRIEANSLAALQRWRTTGKVPEGFELKQTESIRIG